jgi:hypothetical protein
MRDDAVASLELDRWGSALRARGPVCAPLAEAFDRLAEVARRVERVESLIGLWRFLAAGGRLN